VDDVADIVRVVVPVAGRRVIELVDQDRRPSLGQEQDREAGGEDRVVLDQGALPEPAEPVLVAHELPGSQPVPVVGAEEPDTRQPPGSLQAVEIIELPLLAGAEILADVEVPGQPVDASLQAPADSALAAVLDLLALEELLPLEPPEAGDDQAGD